VPWVVGRLKMNLHRDNHGLNAIFPSFKLSIEVNNQVIMIAAKKAFNMKTTFGIMSPKN
jgi:hypothetical protein